METRDLTLQKNPLTYSGAKGCALERGNGAQARGANNLRAHVCENITSCVTAKTVTKEQHRSQHTQHTPPKKGDKTFFYLLCLSPQDLKKEQTILGAQKSASRYKQKVHRLGVRHFIVCTPSLGITWSRKGTVVCLGVRNMPFRARCLIALTCNKMRKTRKPRSARSL